MPPHSISSCDQPPSLVKETVNDATDFSNGNINGYVGASYGALINGVLSNGVTSSGVASSTPRSAYLTKSDLRAVQDLICVGFGPASCAVAVALHDYMEAGKLTTAPNVLFLEKQLRFAWHAGMLLSGAIMQISFIKDLASLRDPRSHFTFLNYLHKNNRLVEFANLGTFLPSRAEYEDYLRWCASHFDGIVCYNNEVLSISPVAGEDGPVKTFTVCARNGKTGALSTYRARNVLCAVGGQASVPQFLRAHHPRVIHSSQYAYTVPELFKDHSAPIRVAVIGAGQSGAEIFNNVQTVYPNSKTHLIMRQEFLKPSDDSPFLNSIFDPSFTDVFHANPIKRRHFLADARATNYGVVRLELLEHLYEKMYHQLRTLGRDQKAWPHRVMSGRRVRSVEEKAVGKDTLRVTVCANRPSDLEGAIDGSLEMDEVLDVDLVVAATGYERTAHVGLFRDVWDLLPEVSQEAKKLADPCTKDRLLVESGGATRVFEVGRNYGLKFAVDKVARGSGVWLQGCCEGTHGLSDTLLSVLGVRAGEIVDLIFGPSA